MVIPRHVRIARKVRQSSSYIAARTRERAYLDYLDAKIERLERIAKLESRPRRHRKQMRTRKF